MTTFTILKHSNISCNAITSCINYRLNQLQVESLASCKVKEGKTQRAGGLLRFSRLKPSNLVDFTGLKRRSARVRQARQVPGRVMPIQGLYTGVGAGKLELELELEMGAGSWSWGNSNM